MDKGNWLYSTQINGKSKIYFEHTNHTRKNIGYCIQIFNPTSNTVKVEFLKGGVAIDDQKYTKLWDMYDNNTEGYGFSLENSKNSIELLKYESCWLFPEDNKKNNKIYKYIVVKTKDSIEATYPSNVKFIYGSEDLKSGSGGVGVPIEGAIDLKTTGEVQISFGAFENFLKIDFNNLTYKFNYYDSNKEIYIDNETNEQKTKEISPKGVYSGKASKLPITSCDINWTINDNTTGNLPVFYKNSVNIDSGVTSNFWATHAICNKWHNDCIESDTIPLNIPLKSGTITAGPGILDSRGKTINWANWGVNCINNITITNYSSRPRTVTFYLQNDGCEKTTITQSTSINNQKSKANIKRWKKEDRSEFPVYTFILPPSNKESPYICKFSTEIKLGGMSDGYIKQYVKVE